MKMTLTQRQRTSQAWYWLVDGSCWSPLMVLAQNTPPTPAEIKHLRDVFDSMIPREMRVFAGISVALSLVLWLILAAIAHGGQEAGALGGSHWWPAVVATSPLPLALIAVVGMILVGVIAPDSLELRRWRNGLRPGVIPEGASRVLDGAVRRYLDSVEQQGRGLLRAEESLIFWALVELNVTGPTAPRDDGDPISGVA